jgi:hypothetical protein
MKRRESYWYRRQIAALPLSARAQQFTKIDHIAVVHPANPAAGLTTADGREGDAAFGSARYRSAGSEPIVDTELREMNLLGLIKGKSQAARHDKVEPLGSKIDVVIFDLDRPVCGQSVLDAATFQPHCVSIVVADNTPGALTTYSSRATAAPPFTKKSVRSLA